MPLDGVWQVLVGNPDSIGLALAFGFFLLWLVEDGRPGTIGEWAERAVAWLDAHYPDTERRTWR